MTSSDGPTHDLPTETGPAAPGSEAVRQLADRLHRCITQTFDDWNADQNAVRGTQRQPDSFARPVTMPPVRMEQVARTPEPTADLDDLVDLLVPRLVERLVPALRDALTEDDQRR